MRIQKQLRLQDAKQVEAKAARIKEWVTNKLRELEEQNQHLREQNNKCNQQLELLRNHIALQGSRNNIVSSFDVLYFEFFNIKIYIILISKYFGKKLVSNLCESSKFIFSYH